MRLKKRGRDDKKKDKRKKKENEKKPKCQSHNPQDGEAKTKKKPVG